MSGFSSFSFPSSITVANHNRLGTDRNYGMSPFPHMLNISNHVTIKLTTVEEYASLRTQFIT